MKPANLFQLEMASALSNRWAFIMRLGLPILLAGPFCLIDMPVRMKASGIVMLILFLTFFGAAVAMVRRRSNGQLTRLSVLPIRRGIIWLDYLLAGAAMDLVQLAGVLSLYICINAVHGTDAMVILTTAGWLCVVVLLLNLLGMCLAMVVAGNQEVHLLGAMFVGLLALVSGLFPVPDRIAGLVETIAQVSPVGILASQLAGLADGGYASTPVQAWVGGLLAAGLIGAIGLRSFNIRAK